MRATRRHALAFASIVGTAACGPRVEFKQDTTRVAAIAAPTPPDSAALHAATAALSEFLRSCPSTGRLHRRATLTRGHAAP